MTAAAPTDPVEQAAGADLRMLRLVRATPVVVWLLVATYGVLATAYALAVPLLHAPDEPAHIDLIATVDDHLGVAPYAGVTFSPEVEAAVERVGIVQLDWRFAPRPWGDGLDPSETVARPERPPYDDLAPDAPGEERNPAAGHPPAYYAAIDGIDAVAQTVGAGDPDEVAWDALLTRWRLWSVLLSLPVPWLAFWTAARATRRRGVAIAAATLTLAIPQLSHSAGSVNNDVLLFSASGLATMAAVWIATDDGRGWRPWLWGGLGAGVAMITKIFGLGAPVWLLGATILAVATGRLTASRASGRLAVAAVVTLLAGGWWPLRLLLTSGTPAPRDYRYPIEQGFTVSFVDWVGEVVRRMTTTGLGHFGIEQFPLPAWLVALASLGVLAALALGTWRLRWVAAVALLPAATTLAMILYAAWSGYARSGIPSGLHGRYLFTGIAGLAAVAATALASGRRPERTAVVAAAVIAVAMQAVGLFVVVRSYWAGAGFVDQVRAMVVFAPYSGRALTVTGILGAMVSAGAVVALAREAVRSDAPV